MTAEVSTQSTRRPDPRKARTRAALIAAGRRLLAEGRTAVSVQEITNEAGVGFGSFYNHFDSKEELFAEAVASTLDAWGQMRDLVVEGIHDPAEVFATSFRMLGRMQRELPELIRVVLNQGMSVLLTDRGLRPRALVDLQRGIETGRFSVPDADMGLMMSGGALLGLMQLLDADADLDSAQVSDDYVRHVLLMLGLDAGEADRLVALPLPPLPIPE
ncbi:MULTISPECIES: TetR/AcrR family transcriptional regulator [unclassified Mycobacterium]|uniref:TetR/AcrR family transcriptional regulator n=1 Tax=unclassified Mycobacterium TaxID=2642494 RepID=UPI00073FEF8C|nr:MULTISPECIES: TetR/AcrR family transcriptional regulator [unclassified Mycobacterium]KUH85586.1 TetR family transcriptional regulator [Mycobacterium sp. GA-1999]KUH91444.1 TetR family transcriptional regulator [Mycobacterium sp. GA-0227b]KUH96303.1 TetR family transcriptional regulator [Mycobacterium sp. IS-1556]